MGLRKLILTATTVLLMPALGWAGGKATISTDGVQTMLEYDDSGMLRVGMQGEYGYMLMRDGRVYTVMNQDGESMVMEISSAMAGMGNMVQQQGLIDTEFQAFESLTDTGRTEMVAGIEGRVYDMTLIENNGQRTTESVVLSTDNRVRELTAAMMAMADMMMTAMGGEEPEGMAMMKQEILGNGRGWLRQGNAFELSSIDGNPPAASRFELPSEPVDMPDMSSFFSGGALGGGAPNGDEAGQVPAIVGDQVERQQQRAERRTQQEADDAADSAVDRALDSVFNSIFN